MSYYNTGFSFNPLGTTRPPEPGEPFPVSHKTTLPEGLSTAHSPQVEAESAESNTPGDICVRLPVNVHHRRSARVNSSNLFFLRHFSNANVGIAT